MNYITKNLLQIKLAKIELNRRQSSTYSAVEHWRGTFSASEMVKVIYELLMDLKGKWILIKTFLECQFGCCLHIWKCHSWKVNRKINHLQERSSRTVYEDYSSLFEDLRRRDNSLKINYKNIQSLAIELFKIFRGIVSQILRYTFPLRSTDYNVFVKIGKTSRIE